MRGKDLAPANPVLPIAGGLRLLAGPDPRRLDAVEGSNVTLKKQQRLEFPPGVRESWLRGKDLAPADPPLPTAVGLPLAAGPDLLRSEAVEGSNPIVSANYSNAESFLSALEKLGCGGRI